MCVTVWFRAWHCQALKPSTQPPCTLKACSCVQKVSPDDLNASIAYSPEWKALEDHVAQIEKTYAHTISHSKTVSQGVHTRGLQDAT